VSWLERADVAASKAMREEFRQCSICWPRRAYTHSSMLRLMHVRVGTETQWSQCGCWQVFINRVLCAELSSARAYAQTNDRLSSGLLTECSSTTAGATGAQYNKRAGSYESPMKVQRLQTASENVE